MPRERLTGRTALAITVLALLLIVFGGAWRAMAAPPTPPSASSAAPDSAQAVCPPGGQCFADVPSSNPFYANINALYQDNIISGYSCGAYPEVCDQYNRPYYRPGGTVTRAQMAKFVDLARRTGGGGGSGFININTNSPGVPVDVTTNVANATALYAKAPGGGAIRGDSGSGTVPTIFAYNTGGYFSIDTLSNGTAIRGLSNGNGEGVYGETGATGRNGVYGRNTAGGTGVFGLTTTGNGVVGQTGGGSGVAGVYGRSTSGGQGVIGESAGGNAVEGRSDSRTSSGVYGLNRNGGFGVAGRTNGNNEMAGIFGENTGTGYAGYFVGSVRITGTCCSAAAGSYTIDSPTDPANKYLTHSAVASPDMLDIYNGNITTDANGNATVVMPSYFQALNKDYRYQLTAIGSFAQVIVATKISDNKFTIKSDKPNVEVSWQVTGVRSDAYADKYRVPVEQDKPASERGFYLNPELFGAPANQRVEESLRGK